MLRYTHRSKGLTELALARLGYADTIVFRPGLLRGAERSTGRRLGESVLGYVPVSPAFHGIDPPHLVSSRASQRISVQASRSRYVCPFAGRVHVHAIAFQVPLLAKAMAKAGALGSPHIPSNVGATRVDAGENRGFTLISNLASTLLGQM